MHPRAFLPEARMGPTAGTHALEENEEPSGAKEAVLTELIPMTHLVKNTECLAGKPRGPDRGFTSSRPLGRHEGPSSGRRHLPGPPADFGDFAAAHETHQAGRFGSTQGGALCH